MSFATIKFDGEECEVEYEFDAEDLIVQLVGIGDEIINFDDFTDNEQEEITMKVLKYLEEKEDWVESEVDEECTRRMEARMEANWSK